MWECIISLGFSIIPELFGIKQKNIMIFLEWLLFFICSNKNPAYGRHWLSQRVQIKILFQKQMWDWIRTPSTFYHGPDVSRARSSRHPVGIWLTDSLTHHLTEQTRTNMSQPGRRPGTAVGNEQHVLQALWSRKEILTLQGKLWVCAVLALVKACPVRNSYWFLRLSESDSEGPHSF